MPLYPGDIYTFLLSITNPNGNAPIVTSTPQIQIISMATNIGVLIAPAIMTLVAGTQAVYTYPWSIASSLPLGDYFAIVSYISDETTVSNRYLTQVRIGDTFITGPVALNSTVAKDATVAKSATTATSSDLAAIAPDNSAVVLSIKAKTDTLPTNPASQDLLTVILGIATDTRDGIIGSLVVDRTTTPKVLTILRIADNSILATFNLTEDDSRTSRTRQ